MSRLVLIGSALAATYEHAHLCQDCLRRWTATSRIYDANAQAECPECGGDLCWCDGCMETLHALEAGERGMVPGVLSPVRAWSSERGAYLDVVA